MTTGTATATDEYIYWKNWVEQLQAELNRRREEIEILQTNLENREAELADFRNAQDEDSEVQAILAERKVWSDRLIEITRERDELRAERDRALAENQLLRAERAKPPQPKTLAELIIEFNAIGNRISQGLKRCPGGVLAGKYYCKLNPDGGIMVATPKTAETIQIDPIR